MHSFYIYCNNSFGSSEIVGGFSVFLSGFLKGFSSQMSPIFSKMMIIMWRINFSIFLVQQRWQSKYSRFPTAQSSSRPTFWRKIYRHKREEIFYSRWLVKIDSSFLSALLPKLIYNEARHTSSIQRASKANKHWWIGAHADTILPFCNSKQDWNWSNWKLKWGF